MSPPWLALASALILHTGCSHGSKTGSAEADAGAGTSAPPGPGGEGASSARGGSEHCPRAPALDDPARRVDQPLDEHAFARCDLQIYGPTQINSQADYEQLVTCADPPGRPPIDFGAQRLMATRVEAPSQVLGATREDDGRILVHILKPGICSGVDWGDAVHVVVVPHDQSTVEVSVCVEPSTCGPGEMPA